MRKNINFLFAALIGLAAAACSSPEKMAEMAENVTVKCEPAVLEVIGGSIDAKVSVTYPEDYFHPKAILEVTPVIVYEGGLEVLQQSPGRILRLLFPSTGQIRSPRRSCLLPVS